MLSKFDEGRKRFETVWKINRTEIDKNVKITDIIEK